MLENGYIQLHRSILRWEWYQDLTTKSVFLHLLLTANYEPQRWQGILIERGQRVFSRAKLAQELGISEQALRTALKHLQRTGEVSIQSNSRYSIATIRSYETFLNPTSQPSGRRARHSGDSTPSQPGEETGHPPAPNQPPTSDQPQWKKANKAKKEKEENGGLAACPSGLPEGFTSEEEYIAFLRR